MSETLLLYSSYLSCKNLLGLFCVCFIKPVATDRAAFVNVRCVNKVYYNPRWRRLWRSRDPREPVIYGVLFNCV